MRKTNAFERFSRYFLFLIFVAIPICIVTYMEFDLYMMTNYDLTALQTIGIAVASYLFVTVSIPALVYQFRSKSLVGSGFILVQKYKDKSGKKIAVFRHPRTTKVEKLPWA